MSGAALVWAANVKGLSPSTKIVLIQLAERHNKDTGACNPSLAKLTDDCEMSRASVLRHLNELEKAGFVTRVSRGRDNGGRTSSQYNLHMNMGQRSQIETGAKVANDGGQRSHSVGGKGRTDETPYIEPVLNQKEPAPEGAIDLFSGLPVQTSAESESDLFDQFWEAYPKKAGKDAARRAFTKAIKKAPAQIIIERAKAYADWLNSLGPNDFKPGVKYPQGWLNDGRWEDEAIQNHASNVTPLKRDNGFRSEFMQKSGW